MGKGGGGYDTSGMERATREGIALQERMYNEQKEMMQPWYRTGASSISRLSDLVGVAGGNVETRDQIYSRLKPQFTSMPATAAQPRQSYNLATQNFTDSPEYKKWFVENYGDIKPGDRNAGNIYAEAAKRYGQMISFFPPQQAAQPQVDNAALNLAVAQAFAGQKSPSDYGELTRRFTMQDFQADPGYAFRQSEGQRAIERAMAARGKTFTPEAIRAMQELNQGLASEEFTNAFNRRNIESENIFNRLATLSGFGQNATGQLASAGQNYASNVTSLNTSLANAQAAAAAAKASRPSMFSQLLGAGSTVLGGYFGGGGTLAGLLGRK